MMPVVGGTRLIVLEVLLGAPDLPESSIGERGACTPCNLLLIVGGALVIDVWGLDPLVDENVTLSLTAGELEVNAALL